MNNLFGILNFPNVFKALAKALSPATYPNGAPMARTEEKKYKYSSERAATRRGAFHIVNPTFHSRQILTGVKPAQFRAQHLGKKK